jgi:hypothetical protein
MEINSKSLYVTSGNWAAHSCAVPAFATIKAIVQLSLTFLAIWVRREQRARE